jgi:cytidine deaminase
MVSKENAELVSEAKNAIEKAYAPYSGLKVGAAILMDGGKMYSGCNIENAVFGVTVCAERVALFKAVSENGRKVRAVVVASNSSVPLLPCGICLQAISEFAGKIAECLLSSGFLQVHLRRLR